MKASDGSSSSLSDHQLPPHYVRGVIDGLEMRATNRRIFVQFYLRHDSWSSADHFCIPMIWLEAESVGETGTPER